MVCNPLLKIETCNIVGICVIKTGDVLAAFRFIVRFFIITASASTAKDLEEQHQSKSGSDEYAVLNSKQQKHDAKTISFGDEVMCLAPFGAIFLNTIGIQVTLGFSENEVSNINSLLYDSLRCEASVSANILAAVFLISQAEFANEVVDWFPTESEEWLLLETVKSEVDQEVVVKDVEPGKNDCNYQNGDSAVKAILVFKTIDGIFRTDCSWHCVEFTGKCKYLNCLHDHNNCKSYQKNELCKFHGDMYVQIYCPHFYFKFNIKLLRIRYEKL